MSSWIIDLSSNTINVLSVNRGKADRWHQFELPAEVYANGFINRPENAGSLLKAELKRAGLKVTKATIILPPMATFEMQVKLPAAVSRRELSGAVTSAASRATAGQLKDATLAWSRIEKGPVSQSIFVAAARQETVQAVTAMCRHAGIKISRLLPYFLAVSQTLGADLGVLVLTNQDRHATVLAVEHGAPIFTGGLGPFVPGFGAEGLLASALQAALAAAGPDSPLLNATRIYLFGNDAELSDTLRAAGYETWVIRRPRDHWPDRIPWPEAAVAWGGFLCDRKQLAGITLVQQQRAAGRSSKAMAAVALALLTALHTAAYGYFDAIHFPGIRAGVEAERAEVTRIWTELQEKKQDIDALSQLRQQRQKLTDQNAKLPPQFHWLNLYTAVRSVLPFGADLRELNLEGLTLPGAPGSPNRPQSAVGPVPTPGAAGTAQAGAAPTKGAPPQPAPGTAPPQGQAPAAGQAPAPTPGPVVVLMGRVRGLETLTALVERLKQAPFSSPHVDSVRLEPGNEVTYQFVLRARYHEPKQQ